MLAETLSLEHSVGCQNRAYDANYEIYEIERQRQSRNAIAVTIFMDSTDSTDALEMS
jgi:hypothetical protein